MYFEVQVHTSDLGTTGCPKHVEQAIRSAIKPLLHLVGILFPHNNGTIGFQGLLSRRGRILGLLDDTVCIAKVIQRYIQLEDDSGQKIKQ